jgi:hypothetical protein
MNSYDVGAIPSIVDQVKILWGDDDCVEYIDANDIAFLFLSDW